jgi:hypothetical protein
MTQSPCLANRPDTTPGQGLPGSVLSTIGAAVSAPAHLLLVGGRSRQRLALLSEVLDKIDERREAVFVYDPTRHLTAQFYVEAHHDIEITPVDLGSCPWPERQALYTAMLTDAEPLGIQIVQPQSSPPSTWDIARWVSTPRGWVFLTHATLPTPSLLRAVSVELTSIAYRIATAPSRSQLGLARLRRTAFLAASVPPACLPTASFTRGRGGAPQDRSHPGRVGHS